MPLKAYNIDVPITPGVMPPVIHIGQYDSGRDYICHLKNDDGTDYTIPSGTTATFTGCNPRKEVFELEATVDTGANTVNITPKDEATSMFGKYGATLNLALNGERMSPIVILMDVQKAGATDEEIAGAANFPDAVTEAVNDWLEENIDEGQLGSLYVPQAAQAAKTDAMTQPVGIDGDGKLWTTPGEGGGSTDGAVRYDQSQSLTSTQKTTARTNIGAGTYSKPSGGIPSTDMAQAVQTALTAAGTAVQPSALAAYVPKAAQANANNFSSALVVAPAGVDSNGAIKSPVAVYGTVTRSGSAGHYTYSANISAGALYPVQQVYPHMRAFLVDHEGRECTLIKPPASDQDSLVFYTLDKANKKIVYYTVAISGATTVTEDAYNGGGGGSTPTWQDILPEGGIPQTDLSKETVTITASGDPVTYTSSKTFAQISAANTAGKLIVPVFNGFDGQCIDVGQNAATFEVIDATNPAAPVQYIFVVSGTGCAGAASNWGSGGGGSGAELFEVYITESGGVLSASETVADIMTAYQSGKLVKYINEVGAEGLLFATPTAYGVTFACFDDADGGHPTMMTIYSIAADGTVTVSSENILNSLILPGSQTRSAAQMASGLLAVSNAIYTVTGDATGFVLTNSTNPVTTPGECVEIRLAVGSTAITTPTWPAWCNLMDGWDGTFAANTAYVILIDDAGNVYHSTLEVTA